MAVPDTNTFSFNDVKSNVTGSPDDLVQAFANATPALFDPAYSGSKDSLLNFRNYDAATPTTVALSFRVSAELACEMAPGTVSNYYVYGSFNSSDRLYTNSSATVYATSGMYSDGFTYRYWDRDLEQYTDTGLCGISFL